MHVLVTGAAGYVGRALATRLRRLGQLRGRPITRLSLVDRAWGDLEHEAGGFVRRLQGDLTDTAWLDTELDGASIDVVFHLASIPGGMAQADPVLAQRVNLDATKALLDHGRRRVSAGGRPPRFVFASSIAVFGPMPAHVDDRTPARPTLLYGQHKLTGESWIDEFSRQAWVDGYSLRLPGVLARPPARTGQLSAFLSDMIREPAAGRPCVCPMAPTATTWASSLPNVVDNLIHAAQLDGPAPGSQRTYTLPTLRFSMAELVDAVVAVHGARAAHRVSFKPQESLEVLFGRFPTLDTASAEAMGFCSDTDLCTLVRRALEPA